MPSRTPSQTIGPFFHEALRWGEGGRVGFAEPGAAVRVTGRIMDGEGAPVADAMIETWQLSPTGQAPAAAAGNDKPHGFARVETAADGTYVIDTRLPGGDGAPCLEVSIFARGLLKPLRTRVYLAPETRVRADPSMQALATSPRLSTLVATGGPAEYRWDVRLQGEGETVFFAF